MTKRFLPFFFLCLGLSFQASASTTLDELYGLKSLVPLVLNPNAYPLYSQQVEKTLSQEIDGNPRFDFSEKGTEIAKESLKTVETRTLPTLRQERMSTFVPMMRELAGEKVHGIVLSEIQYRRKKYHIALMLINLRTVEIVHQSKFTVENHFLLESFAQATRQAFSELIKGIPFDAEIVNRDGYQVIVDYGGEKLEAGTTLSTYTIQDYGSSLVLQETGSIVFTKVEDEIAFGTISIERKPLEITIGNKIRIPGIPKVTSELFTPPLSDHGRQIASVQQSLRSRGGYGSIDMDLGATFATFNSLAEDGTGASSGSTLYPGGLLSTELWLTRNLFFDLGLGFGMATLSQNGQAGLNSNISTFRGQVGYRLPFKEGVLTPKLHLRGGFTRDQYSVDNSTNPQTFVTTTYSGALFGAGIDFPISQKYGFEFGMDALLFGNVSESVYQSGSFINSVTGWKFALVGFYRFNPQMDLRAGLRYQANRAEFEGAGTRPVDFVSSSQSMRSVTLGLSYYF